MTIKRVYITFCFILLYTFCLGQKVIILTKQNGVYTIPCSINGVKRSLVFDTGASTVTISMQLAQLLYQSGKLKDSDIKGFGKSQTASGHIVDHMELTIRDIEIDGLHIKNVDAVIIKGLNIPLLLGMSAIQKLGKVTLQDNKLIIDGSILNNPQLSELRLQINTLIEDEKYNDAINILKKIEVQNALEEIDIYNLSLCYCYTEDDNKTLMYSSQWLGQYKDANRAHEANICYFMAMAYMGLKKHQEADKWFNKAILTTNSDYEKSHFYSQRACNFMEVKAFMQSANCFDTAIQCRMKALNYTVADLCEGRIKDVIIGNWLYSLSVIYATFLSDSERSTRFATLSAICGNQKAKDFCEHFSIDYSPRSR